MTIRLQLAIKDMADAYTQRGGTQMRLAELADVNPNTFRRKIQPHDDGAQFSPSELLRLMLVTGDTRVLKTMADEFGLDLVRRPESLSTADDVLLHCLYCMQHGSDSDADIRQWLARCELKKADVLQTIHTMVRRLMGLAEQIHG
jgi:hypothetical protein